MKNKILILLMSCNQPLYQEEERACRDTFLKDAEGAKIPFYFYKGVSEEHPEPGFDEETHTLYLNVPDGLGGTGKKTVAAFEAVLPLDFDYIIKTNVSTYLNIKNILAGMENWEGRDDHKIYGGRYIINKVSKNVPFPRGYFTVLSKSLTEGMLDSAKKLTKIGSMPKTDDTLICLATLLYLQKELGENYVSKLMQVPSVIEWTEDIVENPLFNKAFAIRCKNEWNIESTPANMLLADKLIKGGECPKLNYMPAKIYETGMGLMDYQKYLTMEKMFEILTAAKDKIAGQNLENSSGKTI